MVPGLQPTGLSFGWLKIMADIDYKWQSSNALYIHKCLVYTYKAFVLTVSCSMKSMELETDSCSYWELVKQSALNSYHIAWLLGYIHVSSRRIDAQRRIATYSQCQPLFSTIQMTDLLAAALAPSGPTDSASVSTWTTHANHMQAPPPPSHTQC